MYLFDFTSKLKRCNDKLYVDATQRAQVGVFDGKPVYVVGVKLNVAQQLERFNVNTAPGADAAERQKVRTYLEDRMAGRIDPVVCGVPDEFIPEHSILDLESGKLLLRGWRAALMVLVGKGLLRKSQAERVFNCSGLGESDYERAPHEEKLRIARKGTTHENQKSAREQLAELGAF